VICSALAAGFSSLSPFGWFFCIAGGLVVGLGLRNILEEKRLRKLMQEQGMPAQRSIQSSVNAEAETYAQQVLSWYNHQKTNWLSFLRLKLDGVNCIGIGESSPYIVLNMELRNYLPSDIELLRVVHSEGSVSGSHNLPSLPETLGVRVQKNNENRFTVKVDVHGTALPDYLQSVASKPIPEALQWMVKGEWWVRVFGEEREAWTRSSEFTCRSVPVIRAKI